MKKIIEINCNKKIYDVVSKRIKSKEMIIKILIEVSRLMISGYKSEADFGQIKICTNDSRRIYFSVLNPNKESFKHFSFNFPFRVNENENDEMILSTINGNVELNSFYLTVLNMLWDRGGFDEKSCKYGMLFNFYELLEEVLTELNTSIEKYENEIGLILLEIFMFEPGYLRYDYDEECAEGDIHPLTHLDIYYSQNITFKVGCSKLDLDEFIDILDSATKCKYLK